MDWREHFFRKVFNRFNFKVEIINQPTGTLINENQQNSKFLNPLNILKYAPYGKMLQIQAIYLWIALQLKKVSPPHFVVPSDTYFLVAFFSLLCCSLTLSIGLGTNFFSSGEKLTTFILNTKAKTGCAFVCKKKINLLQSELHRFGSNFHKTNL